MTDTDDHVLEMMSRRSGEQRQWMNGYQQAIDDVNANIKAELSCDEFHDHIRSCIDRDVWSDGDD